MSDDSLPMSERIKARAERYNRIERVDDSLGRVIGIKRLKPSQQVRVQEMAPGLDGVTMAPAPDGGMIEVPRIAPLMMAAHVVEIDGSPWPFPKTRADLDLIFDTLDGEGLEAVAKGLAALAKADQPEDEDGEVKSVKDRAKNS